MNTMKNNPRGKTVQVCLAAQVLLTCITYDGVHPNDTGNTLLANLIAQGVFDALKE